MAKKKSSSLFLKIMLLLNAFIIIPAVIICFIVYRQFSQTITGEIQERLLHVNEEKQSKLSLQLTNIQNLAHTLARDNYAMDCFSQLRAGGTIEPEKLRRISANLERIFQQGQGIYENIAYYFEGRVIVDGIGGKSSQDLLQENKTILNLIKLSPSTGRPVMVSRICYYEASPFSNTFIMAIELNNLTDKIINNGENDEMQSLILDQNGLIIASDNKEQIMKVNFKDAGEDPARFFAKMERSASGVDFLTWDGQKYLAAFSKDPTYHLYTVTFFPVAEYNQKINSLLQTIVLLVCFCVALGLILSYLLTRRTITDSLLILRKGIQQMSNGDFSPTIQIESSDEIGQMGIDLNNMCDQVSQMISLAMDTAVQVGSGMQEIAARNQDLSSRTQEQAATLEEISSSAEVINASIQQTATHSEQAGQLSTSTLEVVREGEKSIQDTIIAMQQINESSKKIDDIIKVVGDIAFQTNLLALNAAVEAARAGEQGRGFAVVAAEVRNLASRTADASKEIETLIKESVVRANRGNEAVQNSADILQRIVQNTKRTSDVVMEIAAAMREQSASSEQIKAAIEQLNLVTQQNAALVEEITSSSEDLSSRATELAQMLQAFTIRGQEQSKEQNKQQNQKHALEEKTPTALTPRSKEPPTRRTLVNDDLNTF